MIITCENCSTSFNLDESLLKPAGSKVRCSNCKTVFLAYPPSSSASSSMAGLMDATGGEHPRHGQDAGHSGGGQQPLGDAVAVATAEHSADVAVSDEVLPEKLLEMDEDAIAQMLKLDEALEAPAETPSPDAVPADGDALLDLPMDLDLDFEDESASETTTGVEEIDLSELEQVLDGADAEPVDEGGEPEPEPELKLAIDEADGAGVSAEPVEDAAEEIDLSELEQVLDGADAEPADEGGEPEPELRLTLDTDDEIGEPLEPGLQDDQRADLSELETALAESGGTLFSDAETAETASTPGGDDSPGEGSSGADGPDEIDLSELEQALEDLEGPSEGDSDESGPTAALDEADLDPMMDLAGEGPAGQAVEMLSDSGETLDFSELEPAFSSDEQDGEPPATGPEEAQELDLSELEEALAETDEPLPLMDAADADEDEGLSLELDTDAGDGQLIPPGSRSEETAGEPADLDDLEKALEIDDADDDLAGLSLDLGTEDGTAATGEGGDQSQEEIDLSDIEELLESDQGFAAAAVEPPSTEGADEGEEGIDISEIEEVLSGSPQSGEERAAEKGDEDLDLDFDIEEELVTEESAQEAFFSEDASDFEFGEDDIEIAESAAEAEASPEEAELETASADTDESVVADTEEEEIPGASAEFTDSGASDGVSAEMPAVAMAAAGTAAASVVAARTRRRGGGGRILLWIGVLLLLLAGGYVAYSFYPGKNIAGVPKLGELNIPYVSPLFQTSRQVDPGNLRIKTVGVTSRFVDNAKAGRLFVISGKVVNRYPQARRDIQIVGRLFAKGKKLVQTRKVMGGVVVTDLELSRLDAGQIGKRLSGRGPVLKPGQSQPFMIVFSNLPDNLEEFTIEVAGSTK